MCYFTEGQVRSFDDALTSDAELYVAFHRGMTERGFLMLPLNLKRNHLMAAHSDEDVARMLQAAEDVLGGLARPRGRPRLARPLPAPAAGRRRPCRRRTRRRRHVGAAADPRAARPRVVVFDPIPGDWSFETGDRRSSGSRGVDLVVPERRRRGRRGDPDAPTP